MHASQPMLSSPGWGPVLCQGPAQPLELHAIELHLDSMKAGQPALEDMPASQHLLPGTVKISLYNFASPVCDMPSAATSAAPRTWLYPESPALCEAVAGRCPRPAAQGHSASGWGYHSAWRTTHRQGQYQQDGPPLLPWTRVAVSDTSRATPANLHHAAISMLGMQVQRHHP